MSSFREQLTFSGEAKCDEFKPNWLKPDMCIDCYHKLLVHTSQAVKNEGHIKAAMEYSDTGTPSTVIAIAPGRSLFLGGLNSVLNTPFLREKNVKGVVNTAANLGMFGPKWGEGVDRAKEMGAEFHELNWADSVRQVVKPEVLNEAIRFIHRKLYAEKVSVLVNCAQGKSRSSTIVVAYLMVCNGESYESTLEMVQKARMMAEPNINFKKQLIEWSKSEKFSKIYEYINNSAQSV